MEGLEFAKINLRETLTTGIDTTVGTLKKVLAHQSENYQRLILVVSQLNDLKARKIDGVLSEEREQIGKNNLRVMLMDLINNIEQDDLTDNWEELLRQTSNPQKQANTNQVPVSSPIKWRAELVSNETLNLLSFMIYANDNEHPVVLKLIDNTLTQLYVDEQIVFEERLNVLNTISSIFNLLLVNQETVNFEVVEQGKSYKASLSYGVSLKTSVPHYIKVQLKLDDTILYSSN